MLKYVKFFNLKDDREDLIPDSILNIQNEDGPDSVPFRINFNKLSLDGNPVRQEE